MSLVTKVRELSELSSTNAKIAFIRSNADDTDFIWMLQQTYLPRRVYGIKKLPWAGLGTKTIENITMEIHRTLTLLANGGVTGDRAKEACKNIISPLTFKDAVLLKNILLKDLRCGISVTTINKAIPGLIEVFGAMLAKTYNNEIMDQPLYASLKLDGLRGILKDGKLYTRNGIEIQGMQHLIKSADPSITLDGELTLPGEHFQTASGLIRSLADCPNVVYNVFDVPSIAGSFEERLINLRGTVSALNNPSILLVKHVLVEQGAESRICELYGKAISNGYEGLVLKTKGHKYQTKRSSDWLKMKAVESEDLPVIGFFEGEGKYEGSLGGIIVERHNGVHVKVGGGFSDVLRHEIWMNRPRFMGRTAEVLYHEETPDGSLRHPRLKTFRSDK